MFLGNKKSCSELISQLSLLVKSNRFISNSFEMSCHVLLIVHKECKIYKTPYIVTPLRNQQAYYGDFWAVLYIDSGLRASLPLEPSPESRASTR